MELNKVVAIVQARYDSIRFPGKILKKINNKSILEILIKRLLKSKKISKVIVACTKSTNDKKIIQECKKLKIDFYRGSEKNVLERYFKSAKLFKAPNIVRICADCPLIDINIIDNVIENFFKKKVDYASNTLRPTFPDGLDIEIFNFKSLKEAFKKAKTNSPDSALPYFYLGKIYDMEGKKEAALGYWKEYILLTANPELGIYKAIESLLFNLNRYSEVEEIYRNIVEKYPNNMEALVRMVNHLMEKGNVEKAIFLLDRYPVDSMTVRLLKYKVSIPNEISPDIISGLDSLIRESLKTVS